MPIRTRRSERSDRPESETIESEGPQTLWHCLADGPHGQQKIGFDEFEEKVSENPQQIYRDPTIIFAKVHEEVKKLHHSKATSENKDKSIKEKANDLE